ncbi:MAG: hypothetical protein LBN74_09970 [Prevotella sp.]|jgi:hypothetical protein|nr:hypothetical protein [Prevotella sp.]
MKTIRLKISVIALAIGFVMVSCGGGSGDNKTVSSTVNALEKEISEKLDAKQVQSSGWPVNEYTQQLPKPDIKVGVSGSSAIGFSVTFEKATMKQIKEYAGQIKKAGFTKDSYESDGDNNMYMYMYSAKNAAGYETLLSWAEGQAGILISKE